MRRTSLGAGALLGLLTALPLLGLSYLGASAAGLPFAPYDIFEWLTRVLPGRLVDWGIEVMVHVIGAFKLGPTASVAKLAEKALALALFLLADIVLGLVLAGLGRVAMRRLVPLGVAAGGALLAVAIVAHVSLGFGGRAPGASLAWLTVLLLGWGALLGWAVRRSARTEGETPAARGGRRRFLQLFAGGAIAAFAAAMGLGRLLRRGGRGESVAPRENLTAEGTSGPAASPPAAVLAARATAAPGTRAEVTPIGSFYRIDINLNPPHVDVAAWRLAVDGMVRRPLSLRLEDLRARPSVTQMATLECISNPVGGDLISTGRWTGVRLKDILAEAGLLAGTRALFVEAADGYYETITLTDAADDRTLLVYEMNGLPLLPEHGSPLRVYIPNRYGMKQPKWIRRVQATDRERPGYWVERGWDREAIPRATSVIDNVATGMMVGKTGTLAVGGVAYAGARGIGKVELQVDDGPWVRATLIAPALGPLTWVLWRYDWPYQSGRHIFRVRAYDGTGTLQPIEAGHPFPAGASGVHSRTMDL